MFSVGFVIVCLIVSLLLLYVLKITRIETFLRGMPSPPVIPFLGHILYFSNPAEILKDLTNITREFGGLVKIHFFTIYTIIITDPIYAEELLSTTKILHKSTEYDFFHRWLGTGLLTCKPDKWRKTRKIMTPTFHFQILEQFLDVFNSAGDIFIETLKLEVGKGRFNVYPYVTLCTLDVICETAMGTSVDAQKNSDSAYVRSVQDMSRIIRTRLFSPVKRFNLFYYASNDYKVEKNALQILHGYTNSVVKRRKDELEENNNVVEDKSGKKRMAFLDLLLHSSIDNRALTNEEIREEVDTFMFEGHDTTASAIAFTLFCLSNNPDAQENAVKELREIFQHDKTRQCSHVDLQSMRYLEMVIKESLRLFPPVPFYGRKLVENTEFSGRTIPKGTTLAVFAYGMHRNQTRYPEPEKFDPERFSPGSQHSRNPFGYIPFSAGPRNCIGQKFAMLEMKSTISKVLRNFVILPVPDFKPMLVPDIILKSLNGVEIRLEERHF